jgi:hypothetical protein
VLYENGEQSECINTYFNGTETYDIDITSSEIKGNFTIDNKLEYLFCDDINDSNIIGNLEITNNYFDKGSYLNISDSDVNGYIDYTKIYTLNLNLVNVDTYLQGTNTYNITVKNTNIKSGDFCIHNSSTESAQYLFEQNTIKGNLKLL